MSSPGSRMRSPMPAETHRNVGDISSDEVAQLVYDVIAEIVGEADVASDASLAAIGIVDLTLLDIVDALETELGERTVGLRLSDDDVADVKTVADLVELVRNGTS